jgi:oligopeptide/dipeptide ABC transporter ATP-binding protein
MTLIDVTHLRKYYPIKANLFQPQNSVIKAVDDISFSIQKGSTMGLVGESGCGKTTVGKCLLLLHKPTGGLIYFDGEDLLQLDPNQLRKFRKRMGIVYQDPHSSLNPRMTIIDIIGRALVIQGERDVKKRFNRITEMLGTVGLNPEHLGRYPHEFSGGQMQRIAIARTLITNPEFVVLDEPTSALDVSVQAQILKLLHVLQRKFNLTYLFISHDISVIRYMCDTVAVMYVGQLVEKASKEQFFKHPLHPYSKALLSVVPIPDPKQKNRDRKILSGDVLSPKNPPPGCRFYPRCDKALPDCQVHQPSFIQVAEDHYVACHLYPTRF